MSTVHRVVQVTMSQTEETYAFEDELAGGDRTSRGKGWPGISAIVTAINLGTSTSFVVIIIIIVTA